MGVVWLQNSIETAKQQMAADALAPFVTPSPSRSASLHHRPRRIRSAGLAQEAQGRKHGLIAMARNEARRIAANISWLPELLQR